MLELLPNCPDRDATVLLLGAHCDDVEIGCGATVARLAAHWPDARFVWVVFSSDPERERETRHAASRLFEGHRPPDLRVHRFTASHFPYEGARIKACFESLKEELRPDLILTHCRGDLHQDHRVVHELTWNTFRNHLIAEYEIPKFDGDLGTPGVFVPLDADEIARKVSMLMDCFPSQHHRTWFTPSTFEGIARLRGIECAAPGGYAEAFHVRKMRLSLPRDLRPGPDR